MAVQVIGRDGLDKKFLNLARLGAKNETAAVFRKSAGVVRDGVRAETPSRDGKLKRAVISFGSQRRGGSTLPAAFARVNVLKGRVKAPHGLIVETGTKTRFPKSKRFLHFTAELGQRIGRGGKSLFTEVFTRSAAAIRPNPYFQRGFQKTKGRALETVTTGLKRIVERIASGENVS